VNLDPSTSIIKWNWNFGDGARNVQGPSVNHYYKTGGSYLTSLYATSNEGCKSYTITDSITVYQTKANAGADTVLATGQPYVLQGSGGEIYSWYPVTGIDDPASATPTVTLQQDATLTLTTTTSFGCPTTDVVKIKVYKGPEIYVPNAFTPNGDGKNDRFRPIAVGMREIRYFEIYNRYGQLIFSSPDAFRGWDGTMAGKSQPSGTYVWRIAGVDFNGQPHSKKGTITLVR
jgi:gliding motility-associated-like protein